MYKINYKQFGLRDKYHFFKNIGLRGYRRDYEKFGKKEDDTYIILKQEVENLLEKYDLEDMMKSIDSFWLGYGNPEKKIYNDKNGQFWEYLYWRVFHDDENFKPELMRHKIEELEEINFGFATYEK